MDVDARIEDVLGRAEALWNAHKFFECHDVLEEAWQLVKHEKKAEPAADPRRDAIHGLILLAAAYVHWTRGNNLGAMRKLQDARKAFERSPLRRIGGFNLEPFRRAAESDLARAAGGGTFEAQRVPRFA